MGGRPGGGHWSFPSAASRLILVLKREPSREVGLRGGVGFGAVAGFCRGGRHGSSRLGLAAVFSGAGRVEPVTSGSLFGGAIRAEDIAGWGV